MNNLEPKEEKKVAIIKSDDNDNKPRKTIRFILIIVLAFILLLNIIFAVIYFIRNYQKSAKESSNENSYVISEEIPSIYNNIISYINIEREDLSLDNAKDIISMQYKDKEMYLTYRCEDHPSYIKISLPTTNNVDDALNLFKDNIPTLGTYTTVINDETYGDNKNIVIDGVNVTTTITQSGTTSYVSFITSYDDSTLIALCHEEYIENGNYSSVTKVTPESNKLLFDFYYYNLNIER